MTGERSNAGLPSDDWPDERLQRLCCRLLLRGACRLHLGEGCRAQCAAEKYALLHHGPSSSSVSLSRLTSGFRRTPLEARRSASRCSVARAPQLHCLHGLQTAKREENYYF